MNADSWLVLTDYASKYRISVSTLRRRIKGEQVPYRFENGKYFLLDSPPEPTEPPIFKSFTQVRTPMEEKMITPPLKEMDLEPPPLRSPFSSTFHESLTFEEPAVDLNPPADPDGPLISTATKLLSELKLAYMNVLHEKEEQILQLKEEVSDLKTLVRVLEDDNERMRNLLGLKSHV